MSLTLWNKTIIVVKDVGLNMQNRTEYREILWLVFTIANKSPVTERQCLNGKDMITNGLMGFSHSGTCALNLTAV